MRSERGNASLLPLLAWGLALIIATLMLGMLATGLAHHSQNPSQPAWSGDQAPPGAAIDTTLQAPGRSH